MYDTNGKKYLDSLAGLWCTALGIFSLFLGKKGMCCISSTVLYACVCVCSCVFFIVNELQLVLAHAHLTKCLSSIRIYILNFDDLEFLSQLLVGIKTLPA